MPDGADRRNRLALATRGALDAATEVLRRVTDVDRASRPGEWTIRETAVHLIGGARMYHGFLLGRPSPLKEMKRSTGEAFNAGLFLGLGERDPTVLAGLLRGAVEPMLDTFQGGDGGGRPWHMGFTRPADFLVRAVLDELLLHGWDIATCDGQGFEPPGHIAAEAIPLFADNAPLLLRPDRPAADPARYWLIPDPGEEWGLQIDATSVGVLREPGHVDATVRGPAMGFLLWASGRLGFSESRLEAEGPRAEEASRLMEGFFPL